MYSFILLLLVTIVCATTTPPFPVGACRPVRDRIYPCPVPQNQITKTFPYPYIHNYWGYCDELFNFTGCACSIYSTDYDGAMQVLLPQPNSDYRVYITRVAFYMLQGAWPENPFGFDVTVTVVNTGGFPVAQGDIMMSGFYYNFSSTNGGQELQFNGIGKPLSLNPNPYAWATSSTCSGCDETSWLGSPILICPSLLAYMDGFHAAGTGLSFGDGTDAWNMGPYSPWVDVAFGNGLHSWTMNCVSSNTPVGLQPALTSPSLCDNTKS